MVTQEEIKAYRHVYDRPFLTQRALIGTAGAWLLFYVLAVVGAIVADSGKGIEVITAALR